MDKGLPDESIRLNNQGVAEMGRFDYSDAADTFAEMVKRHPDELEAINNLAIATLNRQEEGDEQRALELVAGVLIKDPGNLRALYISGLLNLYLGEAEKANGLFTRVAKSDPQDAHAAYYVAQTLTQQGKFEEALPWLDKAMSLDPYLRSAYYGAALAYRRMKQADKARELLEDYRRFATNPRAHLAEFKYTKMGPKAEALAFQLSPAEQPTASPKGEIFGDTLSIKTAAGNEQVLTADLNQNSQIDYLIYSAEALTWLEMDEQNRLTERAHNFDVAGLNSIAVADIDNNGHVDLYFCVAGANRLYLQSSEGNFAEVAAEQGVADSGRCNDVYLIDADHDGDLDIFVLNEESNSELYNNNRNESFRPLNETQSMGLTSARSLLANDIDQDRDVDLLWLDTEHQLHGLINDRLWQYQTIDLGPELSQEKILRMVADDLDADGRIELFTLNTDSQLKQWTLSETGFFKSRNLNISNFEISPDTDLSILDFDGNGIPDLLLSNESGAKLFNFQEDGSLRGLTETALSNARPSTSHQLNGPALVGQSEGEWKLHLPGEGRHDFAMLSFSGKEETADNMRSNASAVGTHVTVRRLRSWQQTDTFKKHSSEGQDLMPLAIGLGVEGQADYVKLIWPDGVMQTETGILKGALKITETQRQLSSCPVLFAWDGERYTFVSDVLGVGGLGFFVEPGKAASPRPWEYFKLPQGLPAEQEGTLTLKLTEPMEENAYFDSVDLWRYELPPGWQMTLDERMQINGPQVTGRPIFFRESLVPVKASNDRDQEVLETVLHKDNKAAPVGKLDSQFIGKLEAPHSLTLEFNQVVNPEGAAPVLLADGWVEYPYSQTLFAAWQADEKYQSVTLEARDANGQWHLVVKEFGYPAGMPREMALPLSGELQLPKETLALRLTTNLEVYWDRLRVIYDETETLMQSEQQPVVERQPMLEARQAKTGFPLRTTAEQRRPEYNYDLRKPFWDTRYLPGFYSQLGPVKELVSAQDDALAIIGPGEELHLSFGAPEKPQREGWSRFYILESRGYAKDMDMYTQDGEQVGPLPVINQSAVAQQKKDELHKRYHTRYQGGF